VQWFTSDEYQVSLAHAVNDADSHLKHDGWRRLEGGHLHDRRLEEHRLPHVVAQVRGVTWPRERLAGDRRDEGQ
jgi:hypothetical protein